MFKVFSQRLYLRIWLAVVVGVAVLTLLVGWAWQIAAEQNAQNQATPMTREMVLTDSLGREIVRGQATRAPMPPQDGVMFDVLTPSGELLQMYMGRRAMRERDRERDRDRERQAQSGYAAFWLRPPFGFLWLLGLVGVAVALGVFPIIRRLLKRLENLQRGVQRFGEGDLSVRVPAQGQDEVADLARQFNAAAGRIEELVQSHKSLLANASHELRSPLTRIRMGMELMGEGQPSPAFKAEILRNIAELDQLVDEVLLASRLDSKEVDVGTLESVDLIGLAAEECARLEVDLEVLSEGSFEVQAVAKLARRALRNLLENARRYSQGDISLRLSRRDGMAVLRVEDHGPGVPEDQRERIFDKFYRLPGASERSGGVGLGLSLVRSIALRHGGRVRCEGRLDGQQGAAFVLELPLA